eukprot:46390-Chlamydomonas_euryale.AAC.2
MPQPLPMALPAATMALAMIGSTRSRSRMTTATCTGTLKRRLVTPYTCAQDVVIQQRGIHSDTPNERKRRSPESSPDIGLLGA